MLNEIITVYAIIDDLLKAIGHSEDCRRQMSDAEILTTVITAVGVQRDCYALLSVKSDSTCSYGVVSSKLVSDIFTQALTPCQSRSDKCPITTKFAEGGRVTIKQRNIEAARNPAEPQS
jgi:hypothetical protein